MANLIALIKKMSHRLVRLRIENAVIQIILDATMVNAYQNDGAVIMITVRAFAEFFFLQIFNQ